MKHIIKVFLYLFLCSAQVVWGAETFIIEDIRVEGLQRTTPGTVFNYLPMQVGDTFDDARSAEAVRALFKTGFFEDVRLERDGGVLVFIIKERPAIASITVSGNQDIRSEDMLDNLRTIGIKEGQIFNQSLLDQMEQELRRLYFSLGKYAVVIKTTTTPLEENRVAITLDISEGITARIRQINIIGNQSFKEKKLLKTFKLSTPTLWSFFTKSDQYSREKLSADLESLRSFYLDHGYINFNIDSTQVSITPDKKDIYITINVTEGDLFTISGINLAGDFILSEEELFKSIQVKKGELFSRVKLTQSTEAIAEQLGNEGYAFTNVNTIPEIDKDNKTVTVTFFVDPGRRVYVRRIIFSGNSRTADEVLRREMRQPESAWYATAKVERGKVRLQRLGYFTEVNVETPAVPDSTDQVDVMYTVVERPGGQLMAGIGFSQGSGLIFQTSITQDNFLGSGKRISFDFNNSEINRRFGLGYLNPYWTVDGISRGFQGYYRKTDTRDANFDLIAFDSETMGANMNFGIPLTEYNFLSSSIGVESTSLDCQAFVSSTCTDFITEFGEDRFTTLRWANRFSYDTRNDAIFPTRGMLHSVEAEVALPFLGDSLEFYKLEYATQLFTNILEDYVFLFRANLGYGDGYSKNQSLPFFENFYAGGPRSVRGYEEYTLGPLDQATQRPIGGNVKLVGGTEVILPVPFLREMKSLRVTGFFDAGNVYDDNIDLGQLRYSVGLSGMWVSPFGIISLSIAQPFGDQPTDQLQAFQFTFGSSF